MPTRAYASGDERPDRRVALLLVHGMGEQEPYQLTDLFAVRLADTYEDREVSLSHRVVAVEDHAAPDSYLELRLAPRSQKGPPPAAVDIHEVYWADRPQGLIKLKQLGSWLLATSLAPLKRWSQHAASFYRREQIDNNGKYEFSGSAGPLTFLREVLLALVLPVFGLLLFIFGTQAVSLLNGYRENLLADLKVIQETWTDYVLVAVFVALAAAGLFMILGGWKVSRIEAVEKRLGAGSNQPNDERWGYLSDWAVRTWAAAAALLAIAYLAYQPEEVSQLLAAVLRLDDGSPWRVLALAAVLVAAVLVWWSLMRGVWANIKWRGVGRVLRVLAVVVLLGGAVAGIWLGYLAVPTDWEEPLQRVLWVAGIAAVWKLSGFLIGWIGDVAIYFQGLDNRSEYYEVRKQILDLTTQKLVALAELRVDNGGGGQPKEPYYDEVLVAAHSLGSVIAYDALNRLAVEQRSDSDGSGSKMEPDDFNRLKGLFSFGSPLDKVVYFFQRTGSFEEPVRAQILNSLMALRRHSSGRPYGSYKIDRYTAIQPPGFRWHNAWSWGDVLGHRLDHFQIDKGKQFHFDYVPLVAHVEFWKDPNFYKRVAEWIDV